MCVAELIIINEMFIWKRCWIARKCLDFLLLVFRFIPVLIFTTRDLFLELFTQRSCNRLLHLFIITCAANIWFVTFSLDSLFMIFQNSLWTVPLLIVIILFEKFFIRLWVISFNWKNLVTCLLDRLQKSWQIKVWNNFRKTFVCRIEIVPYVVNLTNRKPVGLWVAYETSFRCQVLVFCNHFDRNHFNFVFL